MRKNACHFRRKDTRIPSSPSMINIRWRIVREGFNGICFATDSEGALATAMVACTDFNPADQDRAAWDGRKPLRTSRSRIGGIGTSGQKSVNPDTDGHE